MRVARWLRLLMVVLSAGATLDRVVFVESVDTEAIVVEPIEGTEIGRASCRERV